MAGVAKDEEARAYLQARLVVYSKVLCASICGLVLFLWSVYERYPGIEPHHTPWIMRGWLAGAAVVAVIWRVLTAPRSERALHAIDAGLTAMTGTLFGASAYFSSDLSASAYTSLVLFVFALFTRAVLVASTALRTAIVTSLAFVPMLAAAVGLALLGVTELPGPAFVIGGAVLAGVATTLATLGSKVMHGLYKQADDAMRLGQYTLERKIGQGGMGIVYRARHVMLRRPTAIKLVLPDHVAADVLARFEKEVQHTSELTHPNTVAVYDYGRTADGIFYYAMEYLAGVDLEQLVKKHGPQPASRVAQILVQVCGALQEAHDRGIVHRDIKPANIILCERGARPDIAKVVDFGLVKETRSTSSSTAQNLIGTPAYMAPEAVTAPERIGPASDQYALGAVGYYLLTGRRVFEGASAIDVCLKHVTTAPAPLDGVHEPLAAIILRVLAKQPEDRFASATELAVALRAADPGDWDIAAARDWWQRKNALDDPNGVARDATTPLTLSVGARA